MEEEKKIKLTDEQIKQIIIYVMPPLIALIFLFLKSSSKETKYHAKQAIAMWVISLPFAFIPYINVLSSLVLAAFIIIAIVKVVQKEDPRIPGISNIVEFVEKTLADLTSKSDDDFVQK